MMFWKKSGSFKKIIYVVIGGFLFTLLFVILSNFYILSFGKGKIYTSVQDIPTSTVALVLGGGMKKDRVTMSEMQSDRVIQAVELYKTGKVKKLIMTGDDGANNVDEVHVMHDVAVAFGVPDEAVDIDPHGYNTFKSCARAKQEFNLTSLIAISQTFHLPRIIYFCSGQGIETVGLTADLRDYGIKGKLWPQGLREWLARTKAVVAGKSDAVGNVVVY